ncbi:MAG: polysaccharide biosynthesis C-terminal domain-containing protein [Acidimicrobiales bacterium]
MTTTTAPGGQTPPRIQSAGRATGWSLAGAVSTTVANFAIAVVATRAGAAVAGLFYTVTAIATIAGNTGGLGSMTGQVYFMPRVLDTDRPDPGGLVRLALGPVTVAGVLGGSALALAAPAVADLVASTRAADAATMLRVVAVAVPFWAVTVPLLGATRGLGSMTPTVVVNQIFRPLGQLGLVVGFSATGELTPTMLAVAWTAPVVVAAAVAFGWLVQMGGLRRAPAGRAPAVTRSEFWAYTRPRSASTAFQIALERSDVVLVSALAGEAAAGIYGSISRYVTAGNVLVFSIAQAAGPGLRRAIASVRWAEAQRLLTQATGWMVLLVWPYFLIVAAKPGTLAGLIDPAVVEGATALRILAIGMLVNALAGPIDLTLLMLGRSRTSLLFTGVALAIDLLVGWLLIPRYGMVGAAIAWGLATATVNGGAAAAVARISPLRPGGRVVALAAVGAVAAVVPVGVVTRDTFVGLVITLGVAGLIWLGFVARYADRLGIKIPRVRTG